VSPAHDLSASTSKKNPLPVVQRLTFTGLAQPQSVCDSVEIAFHRFSVTHCDAVGHLFHGGTMYNNRKVADHVTPRGMEANSILAQNQGVVHPGSLSGCRSNARCGVARAR
jgi:hypothetical protein